jgi:acyl carrier protein
MTLTRMDVDKRLAKTMAVTFSVPDTLISSDSNTENLERWDSIRHMRLILALEDEFRVQFSDSEIGGLISFQALADAINGKLGVDSTRDTR